MTDDERKLLETTARNLIKLQDDIYDRLFGMDAIISEIVASNGNMKMAFARLRLRAGLLRMQGKPSAYLDAFIEREQSR